MQYAALDAATLLYILDFFTDKDFTERGEALSVASLLLHVSMSFYLFLFYLFFYFTACLESAGVNIRLQWQQSALLLHKNCVYLTILYFNCLCRNCTARWCSISSSAFLPSPSALLRIRLVVRAGSRAVPGRVQASAYWG
jgi:hypothetical protein